MKRKVKRIVMLKDPQLRSIRTELRNLLFKAFEIHYSRYFDEMDSIRCKESLSLEEKENVNHEIYLKSEILRGSFNRSVIHCRLCGRRDLDLIYNPVLNAWYCEPCYAFNQKCQHELQPLGIYYP
jgi:hypothetical protein